MKCGCESVPTGVVDESCGVREFALEPCEACEAVADLRRRLARALKELHRASQSHAYTAPDGRVHIARIEAKSIKAERAERRKKRGAR